MPPKIFLDSSVILAALGSQTGASRLIISLHKPCYASQTVTAEVKKHALKVNQTPQQASNWINKQNIIITPHPSVHSQKQYLPFVTDPNDAHILAATKQTKADILLTLDKKHLITPKVKAILNPTKILTPKQFLTNHPLTQP